MASGDEVLRLLDYPAYFDLLERSLPPRPEAILEALAGDRLIRRCEAVAGALKVGCKQEHLHFLSMPFYETGMVAKKPIGPDESR